ncbi:MAG: hypothetical protein PVG65_03535 [Candidatus Thorarchaeota archaeon]|jgi:hypothetical protein
MDLHLGKQFNRNYNIRFKFLDGFYNIGIFFDKRSTFLLFSVEPDFSKSKDIIYSNKINMFKNLESSKFCETFLELHNFRKNNLDISNQFHEVKPEYSGEISFLLNETLTLAKVKLDDRELYDVMSLYGFTINAHIDEFIFLVAERQHIATKLKKKIVRTTGIQISTAPALETLDEYHLESQTAGKEGTRIRYGAANKTIKLTE